MIKKKIKQSLYMLADFVETQVPAILILNMMDVAKNQGISINTKLLSEKPGIPVVPMSAIQKKDYSLLYETIEHILVHPLFVSLICNVLVNVLYFALMMASFVLGITLGFNLMEETGYLARISFLFDHTMSKVGLQGKTIMLFFMGLGCTIAIALFGSNGGFFVILSSSFSPKEDRVGLIMELPLYHKPNFGNIMFVTFQRTLDILFRALRVISLVSIVFFVLTYGFGGDPQSSIFYTVSVFSSNQ